MRAHPVFAVSICCSLPLLLLSLFLKALERCKIVIGVCDARKQPMFLCLSNIHIERHVSIVYLLCNRVSAMCLHSKGTLRVRFCSFQLIMRPFLLLLLWPWRRCAFKSRTENEKRRNSQLKYLIIDILQCKCQQLRSNINLTAVVVLWMEHSLAARTN